jgi:hypothetical protein
MKPIQARVALPACFLFTLNSATAFEGFINPCPALMIA